VLSWAAHRNYLALHNTRLSFVGSTTAVVILTVFAVAELIADLLPMTPGRITAIPLAARFCSGAFCGAALMFAAGISPLSGAALAAVAALAGAFSGYRFRIRGIRLFKVSDMVLAIFEDIVAIGSSILIVYRFS
jgi:uncharacterized membrane protein